MIKPYHRTNLELSNCPSYKETAHPLYSFKEPWGPHPLTKQSWLVVMFKDLYMVKAYYHTNLELIGCLNW